MFAVPSGMRGRSQWPHGLRRSMRPLACWDCGFESHRAAWMSVYCECCVLSGRGLCDELITRAKESYRLWCVVVCELETSWMRRLWPTGGCCAKKKSGMCTCFVLWQWYTRKGFETHRR